MIAPGSSRFAAARSSAPPYSCRGSWSRIDRPARDQRWPPRRRRVRLRLRASSAKRSARRVTRARPRPGRARITSSRCSRRPRRRCSATSRTRASPTAACTSTLLPPRRQAHRADRRPRRRAPRLRDHAHVRRRAAAAVPGRVSRRTLAGARDRVGQPAGKRRRSALVPPLSRREDRPPTIRCTGRARPRTGTTCAPTATPRTCASRATRRPRRYSTSVRRDVGRRARRVTGRDRDTSRGRTKRPRAARRRATTGCRSRSTSATACPGRAIAVTDKPARSRPRTSEREIEMCARCHSRRGLIHEDSRPRSAGRRRLPRRAARRRSLLPRRPDQGRGLRVRLVRPEPHVRRRRDLQRLPRPAPAGAARVRRQPLPAVPREAAYLTPRSITFTRRHRRARAASAVTCRRRRTWSSIRAAITACAIPRPDLSVKLGVPNACNGCHDKPLGSVGRAHGREVVRAHAVGAAAVRRGDRGQRARRAGRAASCSSRWSPIAASPRSRARARSRAWSIRLTPSTLATVSRRAATMPSSLVRRAAVHALADRRSASCARSLLAPLLDDPVRAVRIEAAAAMAGVPPDLLLAGGSRRARAGDRGVRRRARARRRSARGTPRLAMLHAKQQDASIAPKRSSSARSRSIRLFVPAAVNLADLYRATGRDADAEPILRDALSRTPQNPSLLHALGLVLVREQRARAKRSSRSARRRASAADNPRYGYVYAVALHDAGTRSRSRARARRACFAAIRTIATRWPRSPRSAAFLDRDADPLRRSSTRSRPEPPLRASARAKLQQALAGAPHAR